MINFSYKKFSHAIIHAHSFANHTNLIISKWHARTLHRNELVFPTIAFSHKWPRGSYGNRAKVCITVTPCSRRLDHLPRDRFDLFDRRDKRDPLLSEFTTFWHRHRQECSPLIKRCSHSNGSLSEKRVNAHDFWRIRFERIHATERVYNWKAKALGVRSSGYASESCLRDF